MWQDWSLQEEEETPEISLPLSLPILLAPPTHREKAMRGHSKEAAVCKSGREASTESESAGSFIWDFQPPEWWKTHFRC